LKRLGYIDWMRGLACVLMFQTHAYDSWLSPAARHTAFFSWSQLLGTLPAPLFIFLAGVSMALVTDRLRERGVAANAIARQTTLRGAEILGLGFLFRAQEFALGYPYSPWTDLLRVDVLNALGACMILMAVLCRLTAAESARRARLRSIAASLVAAIAVALATPPLWTTHMPRWLPWPLESYVNGVHVFAVPQHYLFPLFPWSAFAFAGLASGFVLFSDAAKKLGGWFFLALAAAGISACLLSQAFEKTPQRWYAVYDYWHTSPNFLLMRCGILLIILAACYGWCRWGFGQRGFSPLIQIGNTSLLVYWVHIEFVYGRFSILPKGRCAIAVASAGLAAIFLAMLVLSIVRTSWKNRAAKVSAVSKAKVAAAES
jgi:uncharacterized membrane protein